MTKIWIIAAAAFLAGSTQAQDYRESYQETYRDQDRLRSDYLSSSGSEKQVGHFNRASNLIGADVRTRDAEKVGEVKDVVIDFQSGRVAYIVVDANDVIDEGNTWIAVPAGAFRVTRDQDHVTIEADRNRLRNVRSFSRNSLPAIRTPDSRMGRMGMAWRQGDSPMMNRGQQQQDRSDSRSSYSRSYQDQPRQNYSQRYGQGRMQNRFQSSTGNEDPSLYLYEWYVYDIDPVEDYSAYRDQGSLDSSGRFGSSQYGADRYSSPRQYQQGNRGQSESSQEQQAYRQQWQDERMSSQDRRQSSRQDSDYSYDRDYNYDADRRNRQGQGTGATTQTGQYQQSYDRSGNSQSNSSRSGQATSSFSGEIREIDQQNRTITVEGSTRTMSFKLSDNPTVKMSGQANASLNDLQEGEWVQIGYRYQDGSNQAFSINQTNRQQSNQD